MKTTFTIFATIVLVVGVFSQTTVSTFPEGTPDDAIAIDSNGDLDTSITIPGNPSGLIKAFDNDDMIYTRYSGNTINRITASGVITEVSSAPDLNGPVGLAYDEFGILYVGNYNDRKIYRVEPNGDLTYIAQLPASGPMPNLGFITYAQGRLFGTILGDHKIYSVDPNEVDSYLLFAGSVQGTMDGDISVATFDRPNGILANATGDVLYVTDFGSKNLRVISDVVLSIGDVSETTNNLHEYPNPATDRIHLIGNLTGTGSEYRIAVFDILGNVIYREDHEASGPGFSASINCEAWQAGMYFVRVSSGELQMSKRVIR